MATLTGDSRRVLGLWKDAGDPVEDAMKELISATGVMNTARAATMERHLKKYLKARNILYTGMANNLVYPPEETE